MIRFLNYHAQNVWQIYSFFVTKGKENKNNCIFYIILSSN